MSGSIPVNPVAMAVFIFFFLLVTVVGFFAARWKAGDLTRPVHVLAHRGPVSDASFSPDGLMVVTASSALSESTVTEYGGNA